MTKSSKLYKDSPSIEKDDDGKPGIKKPSEATGEDIGTEGNPLPNSNGEMPISVDQNEAERESMFKRHQEEQKSMHERHGKDLKEMHKRHSPKKEEKEEN